MRAAVRVLLYLHAAVENEGEAQQQQAVRATAQLLTVPECRDIHRGGGRHCHGGEPCGLSICLSQAPAQSDPSFSGERQKTDQVEHAGGSA